MLQTTPIKSGFLQSTPSAKTNIRLGKANMPRDGRLKIQTEEEFQQMASSQLGGPMTTNTPSRRSYGGGGGSIYSVRSEKPVTFAYLKLPS